VSRHGRLVVVGTGIQTVGHLTNEARAWIGACDVVLHLVPDRVGEALIAELRPGCTHSLRDCYVPGRPRRAAYDAMVQRILVEVRQDRCVCVALYGHPGVFAVVAHEAIAQARTEGFGATMLPGISAEDCLFADLGVDPGAAGCLTYDATDFLINRRVVDATSATVLWQIGGVAAYVHGATSPPEALAAVVDKLATAYPLDHRVVLYIAAMKPFTPPSIRWLALGDLPVATVRAGHTLYVPAARPAAPDHRHDRFRP
jgi:precorrin-6B methylase 1